MFDSIYILSLGGEVLLERHLRPTPLPPRLACDHFFALAQTYATTGAFVKNLKQKFRPLLLLPYAALKVHSHTPPHTHTSPLNYMTGPVGGPASQVDYSGVPPVLQMSHSGSAAYLVSLIEGRPLGNLFFLTCTTEESPPLLIITFLQQVRRVRRRRRVGAPSRASAARET